MADRVTAPIVRSMKASGLPIVCVTAYDFPTATIADRVGVDLILVGDSVGNVVLGFENTLPVTLAMMEHHTRAVAAGCERALVIADMPFGSYQSSVEQAVDSAVCLVRCGAAGVKLEGDYPDQIAAIVRAGIPVMGHVGMTPQSVHSFGGFRVQGKGDRAQSVLQAALSVEAAGAFSVVLELVPHALAAEITGRLQAPTIGIGAGAGCDGQIQVFHDLMGLSDFVPKHAKRYCDARRVLSRGLRRYASEVRARQFPSKESGS